MSSVQENVALAERFIEEVWRQGKVEVVDEIFAEDYVDHGFGPQPVGRDALKGFVLGFRAAFPDMQYDLHQMIAQDDVVASRDTVRGTHQGDFMGIPATGKPVAVSAMHFLRFANGKIVEHWGITDVAGMMQQLGVAPGPGAS